MREKVLGAGGDVLGGEAFYDDIQLYMGLCGKYRQHRQYRQRIHNSDDFTRVFEDLHPISPILLFCWGEREEKLREDFRLKEETCFCGVLRQFGHLDSNITTCTTFCRYKLTFRIDSLKNGIPNRGTWMGEFDRRSKVLHKLGFRSRLGSHQGVCQGTWS